MAVGIQPQYSAPGRLADVLALIQVLALDPHAHRSSKGLEQELQGPPRSAQTWEAIANEHPEFFRVALSGEHIVSLVARHVADRDDKGVRGPLNADYAAGLLKLAVELHDREVQRRQQWHIWIPLGTALISSFLGAVLGSWLGS